MSEVTDTVGNQKAFRVKNDVRRIKNVYMLKPEDFYPPEDKRTLHSYVYDIKDGDNFFDYARYNFRLYEQENWYEN